MEISPETQDYSGGYYYRGHRFSGHGYSTSRGINLMFVLINPRDGSIKGLSVYSGSASEPGYNSHLIVSEKGFHGILYAAVNPFTTRLKH